MTTISISTPQSIIGAAMRHAGKIAEGAVPNSEQYATYLEDLLRMINSWQTQGMKMWLQVDQSITLIAGKGGPGNPYTLMPGGDVDITKPMRVQQGYYLDSSQNSRPVYVLSWNEWLTLSNRFQQGTVTQFFVNKLATVLEVNTWLIPDSVAATGTLHLMLQHQITNPIKLTDTIDFPLEWGAALAWGLANEICTGQPQSVIDRCTQMASMYKTQLEDWDVEDTSTSFQPDMRMGDYYSGSFR